MDLTFIESMHRWATNAQVLIKSEAAYSNGMAAEVGSHLPTLHRRLDACEKPNIDKEVNYCIKCMEIYIPKHRYLDMTFSRRRFYYSMCYTSDECH